MTVRAGSVAFLLVLALAGCGGGDRGEERALPASAPILVVEHVGGFLPDFAAFEQLPSAYLTADGRLFTLGPQIAIYPPPPLPNVRVRSLSPGGVARVHELAREAGLDEPPRDYGLPPVADAATSEITYRAEDGRTFVHRVYSLGIESDLEPEQLEWRRRIQRFVDRVTEPERLFGDPGDDEPYVPGAFAVAARPAADSGPGAAEPIVEWPVDSVRLDSEAACTPVTGPDADALRAALAGTNDLTRWRQDGGLHHVAVRLALPDEFPCR